MPGTGYDNEATGIGLNLAPQTRRGKLALFALFIASIGVGAAVAWMFS